MVEINLLVFRRNIRYCGYIQNYHRDSFIIWTVKMGDESKSNNNNLF